MTRRHLQALSFSLITLAPAVAGAHAYVMEPVSRDAVLVADLNARAYKGDQGPCGVIRGSSTPLPRTNTPTQYDVGQTITVKWQETIDHRGCFQVLFSEANDENWQILGQWDDPQGSPANEITTKQVKLPDGVSCKDCTLSVRQLMTGAECPPNAESVPATTYYSCADIRVGDFPDAGPTQPPGENEEEEEDSGTSSGSTGKSDAGSKSGTKRLANSPEESGCAAGANGPTNGAGVLVAGVALALTIVQRRARRRSE